MAKNLVIVESPAKASTIEKYLGKDFLVKSSFGHVRDLAKKGLSIDMDKDFEPTYEIDKDKKKLVDELKKLVKKAEVVWLATDEDREGEAISWHLKESLDLDKKDTKRITFNEITKPAIIKAIESPRTINQELVDAQQARRVLDRLVGFELSPVLWKKIKPSLSAGRVQSVAVRLVVEREKEITAFQAKSYFKVIAHFTNSEGKVFRADLKRNPESLEEVEKLLQDLKPQDFSIDDVQIKPAKRSPAAPFTTSTLQQEASRKFGYAVGQTMRIAQGLYEAGFITYMRTDSVSLSQTAIDGASAAVNSMFGGEYHEARQYTGKTKGAQEAHEAIRPSDFSRTEVPGDGQAKRLYELIWKRTMASQMSDAKLEKTTLKIGHSTNEIFVAKGEVIKFDGFLRVYMESTDDEQEEDQGLLPKVVQGEKVSYQDIQATQKFTHHPARYTEATLVRKLEELGIGRPSTYAPIISTIQKRGYVLKEEREGRERQYWQLVLSEDKVSKDEKTEVTGHEKNKFFPSDIGVVVNDFLTDHFQNIMDYNFTASVEKQFDEIASGSLEWKDMIRQFYKPFHDTVEDTLETSERATGERHLGEDPKTGKPVIVRIGRFGPMAQIGKAAESEEDEKPKFASLKREQSISTITLEEALKLFDLPRELGHYRDELVKANIGRFGPYVQFGKKFVSIKKTCGYVVEEITLEQAIELIELKEKEDREKLIKVFDEDADIQILNGRWGPYIKKGKANIRIPKDTEAKDLSYEQVLELIENAPVKKGKKKK